MFVNIGSIGDELIVCASGMVTAYPRCAEQMTPMRVRISTDPICGNMAFTLLKRLGRTLQDARNTVVIGNDLLYLCPKVLRINSNRYFDRMDHDLIKRPVAPLSGRV